MEYEICYLIGESKESNLETIKAAVEKIIATHKGTWLEGEFIKKRRMAYKIKGEARGTYVARRFTVPSRDERDEMENDYDIMGEINKELRFNQDLLRFMIVKTDDLPSLQDLINAEEKNAKAFSKDRKFVKEDTSRKAEEKKPEAKKEVKEESPKAEEVKEEKVEEKKESKEEVKEEKKEEKKVEKKPAKKKEAKKEDKKKEKEDDELMSDSDIDEKLDEILNI